jgi:hypothetical protein
MVQIVKTKMDMYLLLKFKANKKNQIRRMIEFSKCVVFYFIRKLSTLNFKKVTLRPFILQNSLILTLMSVQNLLLFKSNLSETPVNLEFVWMDNSSTNFNMSLLKMKLLNLYWLIGKMVLNLVSLKKVLRDILTESNIL